MTVTYRVNPEIGNEALNALFGASWPEHTPSDFVALHRHSLAHVCAFAGDALVGYVNIAWDGGVHAFLLDTTVAPAWRRQGVGRELVRCAVTAARARGIQWLHVDYEPGLTDFYRGCGFRHTEAGLIWLGSEPPTARPEPRPPDAVAGPQPAMIEQLRMLCQGDPRVVAATLYGSFATGEADAYSDVEIGDQGPGTKDQGTGTEVKKPGQKEDAMATLAEKLQLKGNPTMATLNVPAGYLEALAGELPGVTLRTEAGGPADAALLFVNNLEEAGRLAPDAIKAVRWDGLLWVAYPKGASKVKTDVNRDKLWPVLEAVGWRPVRQIAIDEVWSALRFRPAELVGR